MGFEGEEVRRRIASFPDWHYDFDLLGHHTQPGGRDKASSRVAYFLDPIVRHYGGSLSGKRVLDLGCNAGYFSLRAIEAGCDYVLGIDGRQMHVDQANFVFAVHGVERDRYDFACANILDFDYDAAGPFDVVLCLGVLYHLNKPVSLFEAIAPANTDLLVVETKLSSMPGRVFELQNDSLSNLKDAIDYEVVMVPTGAAVIAVAELFGYRAAMLAYPKDGPLGKYRIGAMRAFVCSRTIDPADSPAFEIASLKSLRRDQAA